MSHNIQQQQHQLHTYSSPATSNALTLASTLSFALTEIDRLKLEAKAMTNRADYAENLLLTLVVKDNTQSASNTNVNNPKNGFTSPSPAALNALAALMSAESRAMAAESQLAAVLCSLSELLRLNDTTTDARRPFENMTSNERRRIVNSIEGETKTCLSRTSHVSSPFPIPPTESASSSFTAPTRSSSSSSVVPATNSQLSIRIHPTLPRMRPRTISEPAGSSQPPAKKLRTVSANTTQMQPPASIYQQYTNIHPDNTSRPAATATEDAPQFRQTQNPYPRPSSYSNQPRIPQNPPTNSNSIMQNAPHSHQAQNPYPQPNNYYSYCNQPQIPSNPPVYVNSISASGFTQSHHHVHQQPPPSPYSQQPPNNNVGISNNVDCHSTAPVNRLGPHYARNGGIPDDAHHHQNYGHSSEQKPSVTLLNDGSRSNSDSNQLLLTKVLPQGGHTDVKEAESPFNDLLHEWARRGVDRKPGVGVCREQTELCGGGESGRVDRVEGKSESVIKSNANAAISVVTHVQDQSQVHCQPQQMASSNHHKKEDSSISTVLELKTDDNVEGWSGSRSISPQLSYSSINGESHRPTSTLTGLRHLGSLSTPDLYKAAGFLSDGYPNSYAQGEKTCRQCD